MLVKKNLKDTKSKAAQILSEIFAFFLDISSFCFYIYNRVKISLKVNIFI